MVDYTLTVSVSIAAGVAAITSAVAPLRGHEVALSLALLGLIVVANLRGVRESGRLFAPPTYLYIVMMSLLVGWGLIRVAFGDLGQLHVNHPALDHFTGGQAVLAGASSFLLLRAFSSGAVALSGVEAISNGIQAFRKPESRNAAITLTAVATILGTLFLGIAVLAAQLRPTLSPDETILSTMGHAVFGTGPLYWLLQASTAMILTLSANTAFADFPRLAGIVATDGFLPRQLANRGDRLVLSNGILVLALAAGVLLVAFGGDVSALIPLFAVGLFLAFTLSQTGMVVHHWRLRDRGLATTARHQRGRCARRPASSPSSSWSRSSPRARGSRPSVIPLLVLAFWSIRRHYRSVDVALECPPGTPLPEIVHTVVVLVGERIHSGVLESLAYAKSLRPQYLHALHVSFDAAQAEQMQDIWAEYGFDIPLDIVTSPYRELSATRPRVRRGARRAVEPRRRHRDRSRVRRAPLVGPAVAQPERAAAQGPTAVPQGHRRDFHPVARRLRSCPSRATGILRCRRVCGLSLATRYVRRTLSDRPLTDPGVDWVTGRSTQRSTQRRRC